MAPPHPALHERVALRLDSEIGDSPPVDQDGGVTAYVGLAFFAGNIHDPSTFDPTSPGEWSWRVNDGYQVEGNIVGDVDQGDRRASDRADTTIAGFTVGRKVIEGERIDFYARGAVFRHFAEPFQDAFFSVAGWVEAKGYGYFKWSEEPAFRFGFGFGFDYAQSVPQEEQVKAVEKNRNTNNVLNYLEMNVDFTLRRVAKGTALRDCWAGLTIVHRSGIFSTADLLGNVFGGSDWLSAHLLCTL